MLPHVQPIYSTVNLITITLQLPLPHNWYDDFSGFLLFDENFVDLKCKILITHEMSSMDSQLDHREEFDKNLESYKECGLMGYIPFGSLRHTSWLNSTYNNITF